MVELLVVIAVMGALALIAFVGYAAITRQGLNNQTRSALTNLASIFAEYDSKTQLKRQPPCVWTGLTSPPAYHNARNDPEVNLWRDFDPNTNGSQGLPAPTIGDTAALRNTQAVMKMVAGVPAAKTMLANIPPDQVTPLPDYTESASYDDAASVLLDAWGGPILFVPASGLREVTLADQPDFVITSVKVYPETELPDNILAPNARPFFASAGPDGSFKIGDDNLYSFE